MGNSQKNDYSVHIKQTAVSMKGNYYGGPEDNVSDILFDKLVFIE